MYRPVLVFKNFHNSHKSVVIATLLYLTYSIYSALGSKRHEASRLAGGLPWSSRQA